MALFAISNQLSGTPQATSTTYKTQVQAYAATGATTLRRGWIWEFEIGATDVPNSTDCPINWDFSVSTTAGTGGTSTTPNPVDTGGGDAAALLTYLTDHATTEPTYTANSSVFFIGLNQRASQRWQAKDKSSCLIVKAVNLAGIGGRCKSPNYASTVGMQWFIEE